MIRYSTTIPFSGFYCSVHDRELDDTLEQMFQNDCGDANHELVYRASNSMDWRAVHTAYAKEYCVNFSSWLELDLEFSEVDSPREYNFTTDRVFALIREDSLKRAYDKVDTPRLRILVRDRYTSRDGFVSFYESDLDDWPADVLQGDHNQVGTLLTALADQRSSDSDGFTQWEEYNLMEYDRCNGVFENLLYKHCPGIERLLKIRDYLETRSQREGVTA